MKEGDRESKRGQEGKEKKQIKYPTLGDWLNTFHPMECYSAMKNDHTEV